MTHTLWLAAALLGTSALAAEPDAPQDKPEAAEGILRTQAPTGPRAELGIGVSLEATTPIWLAWPGDVGIANLELRLYPDPARDLSIDVQWNWSRMVLWGISRQPVLDVTTMAHWRLARKQRVRLAVAPGVRVLAGGYFGDGPENFFSTVTAVARVGMDVDSVKGRAVHSLYLRPEAGMSFSTPIPTVGPQLGLALEYTAMWKVGRSASTWRAHTAVDIDKDRRTRFGRGEQVAGLGLPEIADHSLAPVEIGTGVAFGFASDYPAGRISAAPLEVRVFPGRQHHTSVDLHWNWSALLGAALFPYDARTSLDLAAFVHFRRGRHARTRFAVAPGLQGIAGWPSRRGWNDNAVAALVPVRIGVDHESRQRSTNHGVYLRPAMGVTIRQDGRSEIYPHLVVLGEYVVTWGLGRKG